MKLAHVKWLPVLLAAAALPRIAAAALVLDTGTSNSTLGNVVDTGDFLAAEFSLAAGETITGIQAFIVNEGLTNPGDTFTLSLYSNNGGVPGTLLFSGTGTYQADGWNGATGLSWSGLAAGNYWAAVEESWSDTAGQVIAPSVTAPGSVPALAYAFSPNGGNYQSLSGDSFGVRVSAVPLPGAALLLGSGLLGLGGMFRRRSNAAA